MLIEGQGNLDSLPCRAFKLDTPSLAHRGGDGRAGLHRSFSEGLCSL